jgi:hypothetical protein
MHGTDGLLAVPKFEHKNLASDRPDEDEYSMTFSRSCEDDYNDSGDADDQPATPSPKPMSPVSRKDESKDKIATATAIEKETTNLMKPPSISIPTNDKSSFNLDEETDRVEELLKNQGVLEKSSEFNSRCFAKKHPILKRDDSYSIGIEEEARYNNMLGESIDGMKINPDLIYEAEIDEENKLFVSN